jgi:hypothetical protein
VGARRGPTLGGGLRNAESRKTQTGHKEPQKQTKTTAVQGGGREKGKGKGGAPGLGHQVNN